MLKKWKMPLALTLCAALLVGGSVGIAAAAGRSAVKPASAGLASSENTASRETLPEKNESVYVFAGTDGTVKRIIVSDWIKNAAKDAQLADRSELDEVENIRGDESYVMNGDGMRLWDAAGNDIYYRGEIDKALPVSLRVTYTLDGAVVSPSELAGKSGRLTVRYDYTNNETRTVLIDGRKETVCVPFAVLTGLLLDNDVCSNVTVTNGKVVNDGNRTFVIGIALPGLQDSLALDRETFTLPEYVEISAEVKNFSLGNTVTIATNELFSSVSEKLETAQDGQDLRDTLADAAESLRDAMTQLTDGSSKLYDGLCTLLDRSTELIAGIDRLAEGAERLQSGAASLNRGASQLAGGAEELTNGLGTISGKSSELNAGARQVFDALLATAETQLDAAGLTVPKLTIQNYTETLNAVLDSLAPEKIACQAEQQAREKVTQAVNARRDEITAAVCVEVRKAVTEQVTAAVREQVLTQVLAAMGMTPEQYRQALAAGSLTQEQIDAIEGAVNAQMATQAIQEKIAQTVDAQMQTVEIQTLISSKTDEQITLLIEQQMQSDEVLAAINDALVKAAAGSENIRALQSQLDAYLKFYEGLGQYTAGVDAAADGADAVNRGAEQLAQGSKALLDGVNKLYDGILTLKNGAPALVEGVTQLRDGAMQLSDGLKQFDEEGIEKLLDLLDGKLGDVFARLKAVCDVSRDYRAFAGISDEMNGRVKFIYRTDAVAPKE